MEDERAKIIKKMFPKDTIEHKPVSNLKKELKMNNISKVSLAKRLGISRAALYKKLDYEINFNLDEVQIICEILNVNDFEKFKELFFFIHD